MSVDHCFSIKGQGTVMTGTILSGSVSLGDSVEIPTLKVSLASPFLLAPRLAGREGDSPRACAAAGPAPRGPALPGSSFSPVLPPFWNCRSPRCSAQHQAVGRLASRHSL